MHDYSTGDCLAKEVSKSLEIMNKISNLVAIFSDNQATLAYLKDPKYHGIMKKYNSTKRSISIYSMIAISFY